MMKEVENFISQALQIIFIEHCDDLWLIRTEQLLLLSKQITVMHIQKSEKPSLNF